MMTTKCKTINVTKTQYRKLAKIAKEYGCLLEIKPFSEIRCFGALHPMLAGATEDARKPTAYLIEHPLITIAESFSIEQMKSSNRPEINWEAIPTDKVIDFVLWHELGHKVWNFCQFDIFLKKLNFDRNMLYRVRKCNEILADRFAWEKLFPGEKLPIKEGLSSGQSKEIEKDLFDLTQSLELKLKKITPLPRGRYLTIPLSMLSTEYLRKFIGPQALGRT